MNLSYLDTTSKVACYEFQMRNSGMGNWDLNGLNVSIIYDADIAVLIVDSVSLSQTLDPNYNLGSLLHQIQPNPDTTLPLGSQIGFFRINVNSRNQITETLEAQGDWLTIIHTCYQLTIDDIHSPETCFRLSFNSDYLHQTLTIPNDQVNVINLEIDGEIMRDTSFNLGEVRNYHACFILNEDSEDLCSDGIDNDNDGLIDCQDDECVNFCPENNAVFCNDGIDNDGDGDVDCKDLECQAIIHSITANMLTDCNNLDEGEITIDYDDDFVRISIDSGVTFQSQNEFSNLSVGLYYVFISNDSTGCMYPYENNPLTIEAPSDCFENNPSLCSDGLDNDNDGLIDCDDNDCKGIPICTLLPVTEDSNGLCTDGIDNDNDGFIDCNDRDCQGTNICQSGTIRDIIYIPNVFSPNANNTSNRLLTLNVRDGFVVNILKFYIHDRYGNTVFRLENLSSLSSNLHWDGKLSNQDVMAGVYVYFLQVEYMGEVYNLTDDITLIR